MRELIKTNLVSENGASALEACCIIFAVMVIAACLFGFARAVGQYSAAAINKNHSVWQR